jgi:hypothetical protein
MPKFNVTYSSTVKAGVPNPGSNENTLDFSDAPRTVGTHRREPVELVSLRSVFTAEEGGFGFYELDAVVSLEAESIVEASSLVPDKGMITGLEDATSIVFRRSWYESDWKATSVVEAPEPAAGMGL